MTDTTTTASTDASTLGTEVQQQVLAALQAPLITYLQGVKANPTIETIEAGTPAIAADALAKYPALQGTLIVDVVDLLLAHLQTTPAPVAPAAALVAAPVVSQ
jgi:hypothetical protein